MGDALGRVQTVHVNKSWLWLKCENSTWTFYFAALDQIL